MKNPKIHNNLRMLIYAIPNANETFVEGRFKALAIVILSHLSQFRFWTSTHSVSQKNLRFFSAVRFFTLNFSPGRPEVWFSFSDFSSKQLIHFCLVIDLILLIVFLLSYLSKTQHRIFFSFAYKQSLVIYDLFVFFSLLEIACTYALDRTHTHK